MPKAFQLEFDFRVPSKDPLTPTEAARALGISNDEIHNLIYEGKLAAVDISSDSATIPEYRIPLKNFVRHLNREHGQELAWHFPAADPLHVHQVARTLSCSVQHVRNQINLGEFPNATRIGKYFRIPLIDLVRYVNRKQEGAAV